MQRWLSGIGLVVVVVVMAVILWLRRGRMNVENYMRAAEMEETLPTQTTSDIAVALGRETQTPSFHHEGTFEAALRVADLVAEQFDHRRRDYTRPYTDEEVHIMTQAAYYCDVVVEGPRLGAAFYTTRQHSNALDVFTVVLARTPQEPPALRDSAEFFVAQTWYFLKHYDKAEDMLTNLMQRTHYTTNWYGVYASAANVMAEMRVAQRRYAEAVAWYDEVLRCDLSESSRKVIEGDKRVIMHELCKSGLRERRVGNVSQP